MENSAQKALKPVTRQKESEQIAHRKELERIARLSGLSLSEEEKEILFSDLARIVPYMERIAELDTSSESADAQQDESRFLREDEAVESGIASEIVTHAPQVKDGKFTVPKIV